MDNNYTYEYLKKQTEDNLAHFIYQFSEKVINNEASLFYWSWSFKEFWLPRMG